MYASWPSQEPFSAAQSGGPELEGIVAGSNRYSSLRENARPQNAAGKGIGASYRRGCLLARDHGYKPLELVTLGHGAIFAAAHNQGNYPHDQHDRQRSAGRKDQTGRHFRSGALFLKHGLIHK